MQETANGAGTAGGKKPLAAFNIIEREGKKTVWSRVGSAFLNRDGSINVFLDSIPFTGKVQLREDKPFEGPARGALGKAADLEDVL